MVVADLHLHSNNSDGDLDILNIVKKAFDKKLRGIAITDHDNISLRDRDYKLAEKLKIKLITGIELSADYNGEEVHILGYFKEKYPKCIIEEIEEFREFRIERSIKMIEKLKEIGMNIKYCDIMKNYSGGSIGRPHIAKAIVDKGYTKDIQEAFDKYLKKNRVAYIPRKKITIERSIEIIKNSKGLAILAHPGLNKNIDWTKDIKKYKFDGLEAKHSKHTEEERLKYIELANSNNIIVTGGSDTHNYFEKNDRNLGDFGLNAKEFEIFEKKLYTL